MTQPSLALAADGRFELGRELGAGGMGVVYEAFDKERNAPVALKTLVGLEPNRRLLFKNEFRALQDIRHPNLVALGELREHEGQLFFTMELVRGVDFLAWVRPGAPPLEHLAEGETVTLAPAGDERAAAAAKARRDDGGCDLDRLRATLRQLAEGVAALHAGGKIHRDLKPSNILVTAEGRAVILDFGLVADVQDGGGGRLVGTLTFMAPEQAACARVGPEADWYAVGVLLYLALTGRLPFAGAPDALLDKKQREDPPPPRAIDPSLPRDLDELCVALLRRDPASRPRAAEILARLDAPSPAPAPPANIFVGRRAELARLDDALADALAGRALTLLVHGESGQGKSALVRQFLARVDASSALVLAGRCYEREAVPYKALDDVIDRLAQHLGGLDAEELAPLLPADAPLLLALFPVLRQLPSIAPPDEHALKAIEPHALRWRGFGALRELTTRLCARRPLVLFVDDLQWADEDSLALFGELLRPPAPAPLLLLATVRAAAGERPLLAARLAGEVRTLAVERLPPDDAQALVQALASGLTGPLGDIAVEAAGHPFFIDALVRYRLERDAVSGPVRLDEALWWRIDRLPPEARALLEVVSVSGMPLRQESAARAGGLSLDVFDRQATLLLRTQHLVRTSGARRSDAVEPYHDRVRETVLAHLPAAKRLAWHARLGEALEAQGGADPEQLAVHFAKAGDATRAARYFVRAAGQARHALAFERAARLYREALALGPGETEARGLRVKLATALANAGRGAEAALEYQQAAAAAEEAAARDGGDALEALELSRRAAEELLRSGRIEEGLAAIASVLAAFGYTLPNRRFALLSLALQRARLRWRGLDFTLRKESEIARHDLQRIDICWSMAAGLAVVDAVVGADFQSRQMVLALDAGEPYRIVRAFAFEAAFQAAAGTTTPRAVELFKRCELLAEQHGDARAHGLLATARGAAAFLQGRWSEAQTVNREAERILRAHCPGMSWELDTARFFSLFAAVYRGDFDELFTRVPSLVREAEARGDVFAAANLRGAFTPMMRLAADDPDGALAEARAALERWPRDAFHVQHYNALLSSVTANLYRGQPELAEELVRDAWPAMQRAQLLFVQQMRLRALHMRAGSKLALAAARAPAAHGEREALLDAALADARRLERRRAPWGIALAQLVRAGVAHVHGDEEGAARALETAAAQLDAADMRLWAAAARRQLGRLRGAPAGQRLLAEADAFMRARHVRNPSRFAVMLVPGF